MSGRGNGGKGLGKGDAMRNEHPPNKGAAADEKAKNPSSPVSVHILYHPASIDHIHLTNMIHATCSP